MGRRNWTADEIQFLCENWGLKSVEYICKKLSRTQNAIRIKARKCGLGAFLDSGDYVTYNQLLQAIGKKSYGYTKKSWIEKRDFPIKQKKVDNCTFLVVYLEEFWEWAEKNRIFIDFSKFEENALGLEPDWVKSARKAAIDKNNNYIHTPWTAGEDNLLKMLLKQQKYSYDELSKRMSRTVGAIQRRCIDLKLKERPVKADVHNEWSQSELEKVCQSIKNGESYEIIAEKLPLRSTKALRGLVYRFYGTENIDKVAIMISNGSWGDGRPDMKIKSRCLNADEKQSVTKNISELCGVLRQIAKKQYDYNDYWQKDMCQHWDGFCIKNNKSCDDCTDFVRILPKYCVRCGVTFFERSANQICERCRDMRRRQNAKKYAVIKKSLPKKTDRPNNDIV